MRRFSTKKWPLATVYSNYVQPVGGFGRREGKLRLSKKKEKEEEDEEEEEEEEEEENGMEGEVFWRNGGGSLHGAQFSFLSKRFHSLYFSFSFLPSPPPQRTLQMMNLQRIAASLHIACHSLFLSLVGSSHFAKKKKRERGSQVRVLLKSQLFVQKSALTAVITL